MNRKALTYIVLTIIVYIGGVLLYQLFQGSVKISASKESAQLYLYESGKKKVVGTGSATLRGPGKHTVYAQDGAALSVATFQVKRWEHSAGTINMVEPVEPEIFSRELARFLVTRNDSVRFLQPETYEVLQTTKGERADLVRGFMSARDIHWIDYDSAVYSDLFDNYFVYDGGESRPFKLPDGNSNPVVTSIDVSSSGEIALIVNNNLYVYQNPEAEPQLLAQQVQQDAALDIGRSLLVYAEKIEAGDDTHAGEGTLVVSQPEIKFYDPASGDLVRNYSLPRVPNGTGLVLSVELSPDTNSFLLTTVDGVLLCPVIDVSLCGHLQFEPSQIPLAATWMDDEKILYTTDNGVWLASISGQSATLVAIAAGIEVGSSLYLDNSYVWFGDNVPGRFGTGTIKRFSIGDLISN